MDRSAPGRRPGEGPPGAETTRRLWLAVVAAAVGIGLLAGPAFALTGTEWRRLPEAARSAYVTGIVDAWYGLAVAQESLGSHDAAISVFEDVVGCLRDRLLLPADVVVRVEQYAETHPGVLGKEMPDLVFAALARDCGR